MVTQFGRNLVFIVSQPRAGSTLLQRILAMSPMVSTASEPWVALKIVKAYISNEPLKDEPWNGDLAFEALKDFVPNEAVRDAVRAFLTTLYNSQLTGPIFVDKTPRYYEIVPELSMLFPQAKIVLLRRNPLAVLASIIETWPKDDLTGFERDLYEAPKRIVEAMSLPNTYNVAYEEMVADTSIVRNLFHWLRLPFSESFLYYGGKPAFTGSMGDKNVNLLKAPDQSRATGWTQTFKNPEHMTKAREYLSKMDAETLLALGYSKDSLQTLLDDISK